MSFRGLVDVLAEDQSFVSIFTHNKPSHWTEERLNTRLQKTFGLEQRKPEEIQSNQFYNDYLKSEDKDKSKKLVHELTIALIRKLTTKLHSDYLSHCCKPKCHETFQKLLSDVAESDNSKESIRIAKYLLSMRETIYFNTAFQIFSNLCRSYEKSLEESENVSERLEQHETEQVRCQLTDAESIQKTESPERNETEQVQSQETEETKTECLAQRVTKSLLLRKFGAFQFDQPSSEQIEISSENPQQIPETVQRQELTWLEARKLQIEKLEKENQEINQYSPPSLRHHGVSPEEQDRLKEQERLEQEKIEKGGKPGRRTWDGKKRMYVFQTYEEALDKDPFSLNLEKLGLSPEELKQLREYRRKLTKGEEKKQEELIKKRNFRKYIFDDPEKIKYWSKYDQFRSQKVFVDSEFIKGFIDKVKPAVKFDPWRLISELETLMNFFNEEIEISKIESHNLILLYCFIPVIEYYESNTN